MKRGEPSHRPGGLAPRGLCDFYCPQQNAAGNELGRSYADSGRLYCRYDVEEADDKEFCMYKRVSLQLQKKIAMLIFHLLIIRIPENWYRVLPLLNVTSRHYSIALARRMVNKK
jgi:hypothetical protein